MEQTSSVKSKWGQLVVLITTIGMADITLANPVLDHVAAGQVTVNQAPNSTVVNQGTQKAIINWQSFNIGASEKTHFQQPAGGIALNRISPTQGASQIYGHLTATGKIILVNQAGIFFGPGSRVDVGGIIASTSDISDANFLAGKYHFDKPSQYNGSVINEGSIRAAEHGLVALVGTGVRNDGTIQAHMGNVVLASGNKFTVDLYGDQLVNFTVDEAAHSAGVDHHGNKLTDGVRNNGAVIADGGSIIMTARAARGVVDNVVNMKGVAQARSVSQKNGVIILDGGDGRVSVSGKVDVSGKSKYARGGKVKILARNVHVEKTAVIDASGDAGGGEILIGGNYQGKGPEQNAYSTRVDKGTLINADAITQGDGGRVIVWADNDTGFYGNISARGGIDGGDGGFVETSGKKYLDVLGARVDLRAPLGKTGTWLLDPENLTIQAAGTTTASFASDTYTSNVDNSILTVSDLEAALDLASIIVQTGNGGAQAGNITVSDPIVWSNANSLTLSAHNNVTVNASISNISTGSLNITADSDADNAGAIAINSGILLAGGTLTLSAADVANSITTLDGLGSVNVKNFTLEKGQWTQTSASNPDFNVTNDFQLADGSTFIRNMGTVSISSVDHNVISDVFGLQGIATQSPSENYALGQDIDASFTQNWNGGEGFRPIGNAIAYTGSFDGQNHVIDGLYINNPTLGIAALFANLNSGSNAISNVGLTHINFTGGAGVSDQTLAGIVGVMYSGTLSHVFVTGSLTQPSVTCCTGNYSVGGLVGLMFGTSSIQDSYNAASVSASQIVNVGGLVGGKNGTGSIDRSYNAGTVSGEGLVGGLIGLLVGGSINDSYNTGTLISSIDTAGGLVGGAAGIGPVEINRSYSSGLISGATTQGGIIYNGESIVAVTDSFWDTETTNQPNASNAGPLAGTTGLTTADALVQDNYTGWNFTNIWYIPNYGDTSTPGLYTRPMLQSEYSTSIRNGHQLQLATMDETASYVLANDIDLSGTQQSGEIWGTTTGFVPIGGGLTPFIGTFNGQGYLIDGLYINRSAYNDFVPNIALFADTDAGGAISNVGLTNVDIHYVLDNANVGALVGFHGGSISNAFSTGSIQGTGAASQVIVGGLVGTNNLGTITDSYTTVAVSTSATSGSPTLMIGGLAGRSIGGSFNTSYSSGPVSVSTGGTFAGIVLAGGFIAVDLGGSTYNNNYWDTVTSGQASSLGATGLTTAQMMNQANFAGWDFSNSTGSWGIIEGKTTPFLQSINTGISGTATGVTNCTGCVGLIVNGADSGVALDTDNSGFFYTLARSVDITDGNGVLAYLNTGSKGNAVTVQETQGDTLSGLMLDANTITVGDSSSKTLSNTSLALAENLFYASNNNIIYGATAESDLYLGNGTSGTITFKTTGTTTYVLDGSIRQYTGASDSYEFNNAITLTNDVTLQGSSAIFNSTIDGAFNLTLSTPTTFNDTVGQSTPLTSITSSGPLTINTTAISTTGNQTYDSAVTLAAASSSLSTVNGNIAFNDDIAGVGNDLTLVGGAGSNTFTLGNTLTLNNIGINGGSGTNTLVVQTNTGGQNWDIIALDTGTVGNTGITGSFDFTNIQNLTGAGGSNTDTFTLSGGGTLSGAIDGGSGGNNTIIADNVINTWNITSADTGSVTGIGSFTNIDTLNGGSNDDNFVLNGGSISTGILGNGGTNALTGNNISTTWLIGGTDSGEMTSVTFFDSIQNLVGGSGADSFILDDGRLTGGINGGGGNNTLTSDANRTYNWTITGSNIGTINRIADGFINIQNLAGGGNTDNFALSGGTLSGSIDGNGSIATLTADNVLNAWTLTSADTGTVTGLGGAGFSNIQGLIGGTNTDSFTFSDGATIGSLDGGTGSNSLNFAAYSTPVSVNLQTSTATGIGTPFSNIGSFTGNGSNGTLTGANGTHSFNITANNSGNIDSSTTFLSFGNLVGGTGTNTFFFTNNGSISGVIDGGNLVNTNMLDFSGYSQPVDLALAVPTGSEFNAGTLSLYGTSSQIGSFVQVQAMTGTADGSSRILLPDSKSNISITYTNPAKTDGFIGDPFYFFNMLVATQPAPAPQPSPVIPSGDINGNIFIQGTTAYIVNEDNMDITEEGIDSFNNAATESYGVNVNIGELIQQQNQLTLKLAQETKFGCMQ